MPKKPRITADETMELLTVLWEVARAIPIVTWWYVVDRIKGRSMYGSYGERR